MFKALAAIAGLLLFIHSANAEDAAKDAARLVGTWKFLTFDAEFQDGRPRSALYGKPSGYVIFTEQGRIMALLEGEGRKPPKTDEERATLFKTMFSYTGMYRLEGDKWITKVDASWNPAWNGTDQIRYYKLDGDRLELTSMWQPSANLPGAPVTRGVLVLERSK